MPPCPRHRRPDAAAAMLLVPPARRQPAAHQVRTKLEGNAGPAAHPAASLGLQHRPRQAVPLIRQRRATAAASGYAEVSAQAVFLDAMSSRSWADRVHWQPGRRPCTGKKLALLKLCDLHELLLLFKHTSEWIRPDGAKRRQAQLLLLWQLPAQQGGTAANLQQTSAAIPTSVELCVELCCVPNHSSPSSVGLQALSRSQGRINCSRGL